MSHWENLGAARALMAHFGLTLDEAIKKLGLTEQDANWLRAELSPPIAVSEPPVVLAEAQEKIRYCKAPQKPEPDKHFLSSLERHLIDCRGWSTAVVSTGGGSLREVSKGLVERLPDPNQSRSFLVKGLVLGYVQSGKTANMAALICRAVDQGYRMIIVLAGIHNDLRAQTQSRLDQDVVGRADSDDDGPFVQHSSSLPRWGRLTSSGVNGDFMGGTIDDMSTDTPKLAVMKKHPRVLERFVAWLETVGSARGLPTLIIDDEADQASINSNYGRVDDDGNEVDPTATNLAIRNLIESLSKRAYVGFTATPFANVLIDAEDERDLFPSDFLVSLSEPAGYFGARQLFGIGMDPTALSPEASSAAELDVVRSITEDDLTQLNALGPDADSSPERLREALLSFVLSSATRLHRNQNSHFSMLVHPSGRRDDHKVFAAILTRDVERLVTRIESPSALAGLKREFKELWDTDYLTTDGQMPSFEKLWPHVASVVKALEVKLIHQGSEQTLDYPSGEPKRRYIVVGGNKLSRGLTLEGLSISFFVRTASSYDTLLQMGRWFGYRGGYADLTRIYVDDKTAEDFADLARVELELRADIRKYSDNGITPRDVVPIIRAHHRMLPTARNRQGRLKKLTPLLRNVKQVVRFPFDVPKAIEENVTASRQLFKVLGKPHEKKPMHWVWRKQKARILDFLKEYRFADVPVMNGGVLHAAISELDSNVEWDIVVPTGDSSSTGFSWTKDCTSSMLKRSPLTSSSIKVLREQRDVNTWKDDENRSQAALIFYAVDPNFKGSGKKKNKVAFKSTKTPLIGLAFVFPDIDLRDEAVRVRLPPPGYIGQPNPEAGPTKTGKQNG